MPEAHEQERLKDRLTPAEALRRRQKLHRRGMGRIDLERQQQNIVNGFVQGFGTVDAQFKAFDARMKAMRRQTRIIWIGVVVLAAIVIFEAVVLLEVFGSY